MPITLTFSSIKLKIRPLLHEKYLDIFCIFAQLIGQNIQVLNDYHTQHIHNMCSPILWEFIGYNQTIQEQSVQKWRQYRPLFHSFSGINKFRYSIFLSIWYLSIFIPSSALDTSTIALRRIYCVEDYLFCLRINLPLLENNQLASLQTVTFHN